MFLLVHSEARRTAQQRIMQTRNDSVGVIVGLAAEARIARRLGWPVAIGGGTTSGAEAAARLLLDAKVTALVSFGLAGGLDPALRPGALLVPQQVLANGERYTTDTSLSRLLGGPTPHVVLGADAVMTDAADKRRAREETGAAAVDLESGAIARVATAHAIPFAVLRAICDPAERALPSAALAALDARGAIRAWRVLAAIAARPGQLPALFALAADAAAAKRSLVARVSQIVPAPA
jgi:adenosylhomocysteine nucleosidase